MGANGGGNGDGGAIRVGGGRGAGSGNDGVAGNAGGDFLRRGHPLSEHAALHPAYRLNYMDLYHQLQASSHSPNASLHGNLLIYLEYRGRGKK